jgi:hypothetical protein
LDDPVLIKAIYTGLSVDLMCEKWKPTFEQLCTLLLDKTDFEQVDDYWGIKSHETGVIVWLYPLIDEVDVYHHEGPFDGFRLEYSVLRNASTNISIYLSVITNLASLFSANVVYNLRKQQLGNPPDLQIIERDDMQIVNYWRRMEIEPGSGSALQIPF